MKTILEELLEIQEQNEIVRSKLQSLIAKCEQSQKERNVPNKTPESLKEHPLTPDECFERPGLITELPKTKEMTQWDSDHWNPLLFGK